MDIRLVIGAIGLGLAATQMPQITANMGSYNAGIEAARARQEQAKGIQASEIALKSLAQIADKRYREGCRMINTLKSPLIAATIQDNQPIVDGAYRGVFNPSKPNPGHYIGSGVTVCDAHGKTAVMEFDPSKGFAIARQIAVTRNQSVIDLATGKAKNDRGGKFWVPGFSK